MAQTRGTHLGRHKVAGALLDGNLTAERVRHLFSVPFQPLEIVFVAVEEMNLASCLLNPWMKIQHLQQRTCATFSHSNYQTLWCVGSIDRTS